MNRLVVVSAVILTGLTVAITAIGLVDSGLAGERSLSQTPLLGGEMVRARSNFTAANARSFARFELYSLGGQFKGLDRVAILRANDKPFLGERVRSDHVTFVYGLCESVGGQACMTPIQVQVWNACERNENSYDILPDETLQLRGVGAAFYEQWSRLELYSGKSTIVIFADRSDKTLLLEAAVALQRVNGPNGPAAVLARRDTRVLDKDSATCFV